MAAKKRKVAKRKNCEKNREEGDKENRQKKKVSEALKFPSLASR